MPTPIYKSYHYRNAVINIYWQNEERNSDRLPQTKPPLSTTNHMQRNQACNHCGSNIILV